MLQFPDQKLVQRTLAGEREAFDVLFHRHAGRVFQLVRRLTGNEAEAEDVTQEAFVAAYHALPSWRAEGRFGTWLCGIAFRLYANTRRAAERHPTEALPEEHDLPSPEPGPWARCAERELAERIDAAVSRLPQLCREVFLLVKVEGLSYREAAGWLDIPVGTVQSRLARAVTLLRFALADLNAEPTRSAEPSLSRVPVVTAPGASESE